MPVRHGFWKIIAPTLVAALFASSGDAKERLSKEDAILACKAMAVCGKYSKARQECAVAGDFNNCMTVKMGSDDYSYCTNDGQVFGLTPELVPNSARCWGLLKGIW